MRARRLAWSGFALLVVGGGVLATKWLFTEEPQRTRGTAVAATTPPVRTWEAPLHRVAERLRGVYGPDLASCSLTSKMHRQFTFRLELRIAPAGAIENALVTGGPLVYETCVHEKMEKWTFPGVEEISGVTLDLTVEVLPGSTSRVRASGKYNAVSGGGISQTWDHEVKLVDDEPQ